MSRSCLNCPFELFACLDPDMSFDEATLRPPLPVFHCEALSLQKVSITKPYLLGPLVLATTEQGGKKKTFTCLFFFRQVTMAAYTELPVKAAGCEIIK